MVRKGNGFIFTTDAFLALPLIILAISSFLAFSISLRDNLTIQEYAYRMAKDSLNVLIDSTPYQAGVGDSNLTFAYLIANYTSFNDLNSANQTAAILDSIIPQNAAYILEYKGSSNSWVEIRKGGLQTKFSSYAVQVSTLRLIAELSPPQLTPFASCASELVCTANVKSQYKEGKLVGPILLRIRIFV
jgi:hypothetical protein